MEMPKQEEKPSPWAEITMSAPRIPRNQLTPELLIRAYSAGIFPMSEGRDDPDIFWVDPERRGVIPLDTFYVPKSLKKVVRKNVFEVRVNTAFAEVIGACALPRPDHEDTWINTEIETAYTELHKTGFAHSIECWKDGNLVGGLYGVALAGAFFGESMFSKETDASKVALVHLVARLRLGGYVLLDTQFITDHLRTFGANDIPARFYLERLNDALQVKGRFRPVNYSGLGISDDDWPDGAVSSEIETLLAQPKTQTS